MPDPLQDFPENQRAAILEAVEDLPALGNALAASPLAGVCFDQNASRIFSAATRTFPKELQQTIRASVVALSDANAHTSLFPGEILHNREIDYNTTTEWEDSLAPVNFDLDPRALRRALDLAKRAYLLSTLCLKTHLSRLNDLHPEHLAKPSFQFSSYPFRNYPAGKAYVPSKLGPSTWVEEYRVRRAMWRLQLFSLLTQSGTRVVQSKGPYIPLKCCSRSEEFNRFWSLLTRWEIDEILTVQEFLEASRISLRAPPSFIDTKIVIPEFYPILKRPKTAPHHDDITAESIAPVPELPPTTAFLATPDKSNQMHKDLKDQDFIAIKRSTEAYNFFHRYGLLHTNSPLQRSKWENFRRLGFGIWDQDRMNAMGLSRLSAQKRRDRGGVDPLSIDNMAFTWRSVESQAPAEPHAEALEGAIAGAGLTMKESAQDKPADDFFTAGTKEKKNAHSALSMLNGVTGSKASTPAGSPRYAIQGPKLSKIERLYGINAANGDQRLPPTSHPQDLTSDEDDVARTKRAIKLESSQVPLVQEIHLDEKISRSKLSTLKNALKKSKKPRTDGESFVPGGVVDRTQGMAPLTLALGEDDATLAGSPTSSMAV